MAITKDSLQSIPTSYATVSVGSTKDALQDKLKAISNAGFSAVELGFPDLLSFANRHLEKEVKEEDYDNLVLAALEVKKLCSSNELQILMLQPFSNFEGWPAISQEREEAFARASGWIRIMQALGTDMLQVGSSDSENIAADFDVLASDLAELADLLNKHGFRLAYENWCWATHASTWKDVWEIVKRVNRPNIGLCLDTFQTAGGEWADPTTSSGRIESKSPDEVRTDFEKSLHELSRTIPADKIYLLQISDAYKPPTPLDNEPDEAGLRPRGRWSHDFRPYPYNGGYLPVVDVTRAVLKTGFRNWFSIEVFDGGRDGKWEGERDMEEFTKGAIQSHVKLLKECAE